MNSFAVHIRRCHVCGKSSENVAGKVVKCNHCGKSLAPFFFFNESDIPIFSDTEIRGKYFGDHPKGEIAKLGPRDSNPAAPIWGIAVFWGAE